jgi:hypothetical protein
LSGILDTYVQGGQIMWFTVFQSIFILISLILISIFAFNKKYKFLNISKILLLISLISASVGYHIHILNRTKLLNEYLNLNQKLSRDLIIGGNDQTLIFPNFEIWFVSLTVLLLITVYIIETSNKRIKR